MARGFNRLAVFLWIVVFMLPAISALAETAGIVKGTVTDDHTHAPVAGAAVTASSPSGTYHAVTDAQGRYAFLSVLPDNYSISFRASGYQPASTVIVVLNGSQQTVDMVLSKALKTIATTHARSPGSAFQRGMTIDTYTVTLTISPNRGSPTCSLTKWPDSSGPSFRNR